MNKEYPNCRICGEELGEAYSCMHATCCFAMYIICFNQLGVSEVGVEVIIGTTHEGVDIPNIAQKRLKTIFSVVTYIKSKRVVSGFYDSLDCFLAVGDRVA